jgi:uncharacterized protein (TIGR02996 family)
MTERAAFLRAIAEQPADRTARLVFADFLTETADASDTARAEFIRAQVERDTVHPNSNRAAELESRAENLFGTHWLDWWAPVCSVVGLPPPRSAGVRGWLTRQLVGAARTDGRPYKRRWPTTIGITVGQDKPPLDALHRVQFRGGFPEALSFIGSPGFAAHFLGRWSDASPLAELDLHGILARDWHMIDGPHLAGLRTLRLGQSAGAGMRAIGNSAHLSRLEALHLDPDRSNSQWPPEQYRAFGDSSLGERLSRLSLVLTDVTEVLALHGAPLGHLTALEIRAPRGLSEREEFDRAALAALDLLSLPHLMRLDELTLDATAAQSLDNADRAVLGRLRKLELSVNPLLRPALPLKAWNLAPTLTDLSLAVTDWPIRWVLSLAGSPIVGQVRHLRLDGSLKTNPDGVHAMLQLARALDTRHLETLRLGETTCPSPAVRAVLAEKLGDRVRFG